MKKVILSLLFIFFCIYSFATNFNLKKLDLVTFNKKYRYAKHNAVASGVSVFKCDVVNVVSHNSNIITAVASPLIVHIVILNPTFKVGYHAGITKTKKVKSANNCKNLTKSFLNKKLEMGANNYVASPEAVNEFITANETNTLNFSFCETNSATIYPNPVINELNINWNVKVKENVCLAIYNLKGDLVKNYTEVNGQSYSTNASYLKKGVYILKLKNALTNNVITERKFVKKSK